MRKMLFVACMGPVLGVAGCVPDPYPYGGTGYAPGYGGSPGYYAPTYGYGAATVVTPGPFLYEERSRSYREGYRPELERDRGFQDRQRFERERFERDRQQEGRRPPQQQQVQAPRPFAGPPPGQPPRPAGPQPGRSFAPPAGPPVATEPGAGHSSGPN